MRSIILVFVLMLISCGVHARNCTPQERADANAQLDAIESNEDTQDTGIGCDDFKATLSGETFGGDAFTGTDSIKAAGCQ